MKKSFLVCLVFAICCLLPMRVLGMNVDQDANGALDIQFGGTNATTAPQALTNLGAQSSLGATSPSPGVIQWPSAANPPEGLANSTYFDAFGNLHISGPIIAPNYNTYSASAGGLEITNFPASPTELSVSLVSVSLLNENGTGAQGWGTSGGIPTELTANGETVGLGGLDAGSLAGATWYYVWLIGNGTNEIGALLSTGNVWADVNQTNISGYSYAKLVGCALTDSSAHFVAFHQFGNEFLFDVPEGISLPTPTALANVGAPTVTNFGTYGATLYSYEVVAVGPNGGWTLGSATQTSSGNSTLNATNYNVISWTGVPNATSYVVFRTVSGGNPATTGLIAEGVTGTSFSDTGGDTNGTAPPAVNTAGCFTECAIGPFPPIAVKGLYAVTSLQATVASGVLVLSADGVNSDETINVYSGDNALSMQFEMTFLTPGTFWETYNNIPASSLNVVGFMLNL